MTHNPPADPLPGLNIDEVLHPIWSKPDHLDGTEPEHIKAAYWALWSKVQPFDGRPNSEHIIGFLLRVWTLLALETAHTDRWWLISQIVRFRFTIDTNCPQAQITAINTLTISLIDTIGGAP